jgi:hypothetical protein
VVRRGIEITRADAVAHRRTGLDIVVCGEDSFATCKEAQAIESAGDLWTSSFDPSPES